MVNMVHCKYGTLAVDGWTVYYIWYSEEGTGRGVSSLYQM